MIHFSKYHGLGNDFIIIDSTNTSNLNGIDPCDSNFAKTICNRHYGVGADGLIILLKSTNQADYRMRIFNADGSEAEMCGNGIRCLSRFIAEKVIKNIPSQLVIQTLAGNIKSVFNNNYIDIQVDMGKPILDPECIPTKLKLGENGIPQGKVEINSKYYYMAAVGMGNPHLVVNIDDLDLIDVKHQGYILERSKYFPLNTNVHFIKIISNKYIKAKVWERGAGQTLACGTGACAILVSSFLMGLTQNKAIIELPGGLLNIEWPNINSSILMTGPATYIYDAIIEDNLIEQN